MRNMFKGRPDWCVSRQRVWGVSDSGFLLRRAATKQSPIRRSSITSPISLKRNRPTPGTHAKRASLLPEGYKCKKCGGDEWTKETDILDVWFDSGSSSIAVLENRRELRWPADVYIEGGDQFRGWFNSSLMVGLAAHDRAPYKTVSDARLDRSMRRAKRCTSRPATRSRRTK